MQKVLVSIVGVICLVVWSFVILLFFKAEPPIMAKDVSEHFTALHPITAPNEWEYIFPEALEQEKKEINGENNDIIDNETALTKKEISEISDSNLVSIDELLSALNLN